MTILNRKHHEFFIVIFIIFSALIIFTPGNFGHIFGGETWKAWAASKMLLDSGKFINHTFGPLYYSFLTLLSPFNYKTSIILEYLITHTFCLYAFYKLIGLKNLKILSILLPIVWIPFLAFIESPKYIFAIAFLCLHLSTIKNQNIFSKWLPPYLLCAVLCNWGYILFLIGHICGKLISSNKKEKEIKLELNSHSIVSSFLILLFALTFINKIDKPYNNHFITIYNHSPIPLTSPFLVGFFQHGNHKYANKKINDNSKLMEADWYFTNKEAFSNCKSFTCAVLNEPKFILTNVRSNLGTLSRNLTSLFFSPGIFKLDIFYFLPFFFVGLFISINGFIGLFVDNLKKINFPLLSSITIGSSAYIFALALTGSGFRYVCALMPVVILLILFSSSGFIYILNKYSVVKNKIKLNKLNSNFLLIIAFSFVLIFNIFHQIKDFDNKQFLNIAAKNDKRTNDKKINYFKSYQEVFKHLDKNKKVLTLEDTWFNGFANVNKNNVYGIFVLPPFKPNDNSVNDFLDSLDIIAVSDILKQKTPSLSTQKYLRYKLHIKNYLESNAHKWNLNKISNYGSIYIKKR